MKLNLHSQSVTWAAFPGGGGAAGRPGVGVRHSPGLLPAGVGGHVPRSRPTVVHAAAEATLVPPPSLDELHEGAHVGLAPVASHGSSLSVIHQVQGGLRGASPVSAQAPQRPRGSPGAPRVRQEGEEASLTACRCGAVSQRTRVSGVACYKRTRTHMFTCVGVVSYWKTKGNKQGGTNTGNASVKGALSTLYRDPAECVR